MRYRYGSTSAFHKHKAQFDEDLPEHSPERTWKQRLAKKRERLHEHNDAYDKLAAGHVPETVGPENRVIDTHKDKEHYETWTWVHNPDYDAWYDDNPSVSPGEGKNPHPPFIQARTTAQRDVVVKHDPNKVERSTWTDQKRYADAVREQRLQELRDRADEERAHFGGKDRDKRIANYEKSMETRRKDEGYWNTQHQEVKAQRKRAKKSYQEGNVERTYNFAGDGLKTPSSTKQRTGDLGIASAEETVHRLNTWELMDPKDKYVQDSLEFSLSKAPIHKENYDPDTEQIEIESQELRKVLTEAGVRGAKITRIGTGDDYHYKVTTEEGYRISPAHAALVEYKLAEEYGIKTNDSGELDFARHGAAMQPKRLTTRPGEDLPTSVNKKDVRKSDTKNRLENKVQLGNREVVRDPHTGAVVGLGELKEGEKDTLRVGVRLPKQTKDQQLYLNLQERSDGIGWGTSYRPGEKELNDTVLAGARWNQLADLGEAYEAYGAGDTSKIDAIVKQHHPDADTDEEIKHWRNELLEVGGAGVAASAYTARKTAKTHGVHNFFNRIDPEDKLQLRKYHVLPTIEHAYLRPTGHKLDRALWRVNHPLRDPLRPELSPLEFGFTPELPSIRYRHRFVKIPDEYSGQSTEGWDVRKYQRERRLDAQTRELARAQHQINEQIAANPTKAGGKVKRYAVLHSSDSVLNKSSDIGFEGRWNRIATPEEAAGLNWRVNRMELSAAKRAATLPGPDGRHLKVAGKAGLYGLGALAVAGAGVYAYDKHKQHQIANGTDSEKTWKERVPETINIPRAEWYTTRNYSIPTNVWTDALDVEGRDVPYSWKVRNNPKKIRLRNHKDISGEGYKSAPLVGGVGLGGQVKNDGSWTNSIAYKQREPGAGRYMETAGSTKNKYDLTVKGKDTGLYFNIGDKERWGKGDLRQGNPNKLTQDDRDKIALSIMYGGPEGEAMKRYYGDDAGIVKILDDPDERLRVEQKHNSMYRWSHNRNRQQVIRDEFGGYYYEDELSAKNPLVGRGRREILQGGSPTEGTFKMSPEEIRFAQEQWDSEIDRENRAFHGTIGMTSQDRQDEAHMRRSGPLPGVNADQDNRFDNKRREARKDQ